MLKSDLKQIKQIVDESLDKKLDEKFKENNKNLITKDDLKQAFKENNKNLVTKDDLKQAFKENNKKIFKRMDEMEERIMTATQREFNVIDERFNNVDESIEEVKNQLKTKVDKNDLEDWKFDQQFETDIDSLKYVNIDKLKTLPARKVIVKELIKNGLK